MVHLISTVSPAANQIPIYFTIPVRFFVLQASCAEEASWLLELIGPELLFALLHEQLLLYNTPPPPAPAPAMPSARQERAARTGYGVSDVAPAPSASSPADEDLDGAIRCFVSRDASGWRRLCDVCSTSLFNVRLAADDAVRPPPHAYRHPPACKACGVRCSVLPLGSVRCI